MPQYVIVYLGGDQPSSPEEGKQHFLKYNIWIGYLHWATQLLVLRIRLRIRAPYTLMVL